MLLLLLVVLLGVTDHRDSKQASPRMYILESKSHYKFIQFHSAFAREYLARKKKGRIVAPDNFYLPFYYPSDPSCSSFTLSLSMNRAINIYLNFPPAEAFFFLLWKL